MPLAPLALVMSTNGAGSASRAHAKYGNGTHSIDASELAWSPEGLVERLRQTFRSPSYRAPVLPSVALELLSLTRNMDVQLRHVLKLLEKDSLIAGEVLKLAQSSLYQRAGTARTLEQAVTRLGLKTLSDLCLHASMTARVFRAPGYETAMNKLRLHSALTAQISRLASTHVAFPDDYAYTCGLMHDIGVAGCLVVLGDAPRGQERPPLEEIVPAIREVRQEAGEALAKLWQLPEDVRFAITMHGQPVIQGRTHPLIAAIGLAEALATELGAPGVADIGVFSMDSLAAMLSLSAADLQRLRKSAERVAAEIQ